MSSDQKARAVFAFLACYTVVVGSIHVPGKQQHRNDKLATLQASNTEVSIIGPSNPADSVFVGFILLGVAVLVGCRVAGSRSQHISHQIFHETSVNAKSSSDTETASIADDKRPESSANRFFDMSAATFIVNIVADVAPVGFLPVASGIVDIGFVPAFICIIIVACLATYTMWMYAKNCESTGSMQLDRQWEMVIGKDTAWVPIVANGLACFGDTVAFTCFFGDIFKDVFPTIGLNMTRTQCCVMFSAFPILPLCLINNLSSLGPTSAMGVSAIVFTLIAMAWRALDGTYHKGGIYFTDLKKDSLYEDLPRFSGTHHLYAFTFLACLKLLNTLSLSFLTHYNACKYYSELKAASPKRFAKLSAIALSICGFFYCLSMILGYTTFGYHAEEMILMNYAPEDTLLNVASFATGIALVVAYPVTFTGLRESAMATVKILVPSDQLPADLSFVQELIALFFVSLVVITSVHLVDDGLMIGLVGSICGSTVIFIVPTLLYIFSTISGLEKSQGSMFHKRLATLLLVFGIFIMVVSTIEICLGVARGDELDSMKVPLQCHNAAHRRHVWAPWRHQSKWDYKWWMHHSCFHASKGP